METIRVTFAFPVGTSPGKMALVLRNYADLYDPGTPNESNSGTIAVSNPRPTPAAKTAKKKPAVVEDPSDDFNETATGDSFSDDFAEASAQDDFEEALVEPPPKEKKSAKPKKLKVEDVIAACKARAEGGKYKEVVEILKTKFKVKSVHELKEEQWPVCIKAMA